MKIAYLTQSMSVGGSALSLLYLLKSLKQENNGDIEIIIFCAANSFEKEIEIAYQQLGIRIIYISLPFLYSCKTLKPKIRYFIFNIKKYLKSDISNLLKENNIDILHVNTTGFSYMYKKIKKHTNVKIITHARELIVPNKFGIHYFIINNITKYSDRIICISENEAKNYYDSSKTIVIPNPLPPIFYKNSKKNEFSNDRVIVSMFSRFSYEKGNLLFVKSAKLLLKLNKDKNLLFLIVGSSTKNNNSKNKNLKNILRKIISYIDYRRDYENFVKKYVIRNNLSNYIKFVEYTTDIYDILFNTDIVVRPALTEDPWGRDIIEAFALRKPIVATGNSNFYVKNGYNGFLVKPKLDEISNAINILINNQQKRIIFGERGYEIVINMCDPKKHLQSILKEYKNVLKV